MEHISIKFYGLLIITLTLEGILPLASPIPFSIFFFCSCFLRSFFEAGIMAKFVYLKRIENEVQIIQVLTSYKWF